MEGNSFSRHNSIKSQDHGQRVFFISVVSFTGILLAILISLTPAGADDLLFMLPSKGHAPGIELWSMMTGELGRIWETQSGRLGNFLAMPMLYLFPKWVFGLITGFLTSLIIFMACRVSGTRQGSTVSWLLYATIVFAYPWYDFLTLVTYGINYIWAAAAAVAAIACFLKIQSLRGPCLAAACLLMFVAGWMHEGFGAPLTVGLTLSILYHLKETDRRQLTALLFSALGTGMTMLSPMFWKRSEIETHMLTKLTYSEMLIQIGPAMLFAVALIILIIISASKSSFRKNVLTSPRLLIFSGAALAATAVCLKFYTGPRTGAPVILFSALSCSYILTRITSGVITPLWVEWTAGLSIAGLSLLHLSYADIKQVSRSQEYVEVCKLYEEAEDGVFFYDPTYPIFDLSLYKTSVIQLHQRDSREFMRMYFNPEHKMTILPTALRGFKPDKAVKSEMTPGAMIFNGWAILPDSIDTNSFHRIHVLTETGEYLPSRFRADRFEYPGHGHYFLITPHIKILDHDLRVKDIALDDHSR